MSKIESFFSKLFLTLVSITISFVLVEVVANYYLWNIASLDKFNLYASINQVRERYGNDFFISTAEHYKPIYSPHHYIGYIPTPNYLLGENRHNSHGFRGEEFAIEKPLGTYRIVALGESTTYGTGVENYQHTYPYQLQVYLQDQGYTNVEVINAGAGEYSSYETYLTLMLRVMDLQPDLIVSYQGLNDIDTRFVYPPELYRGDNSGYRDVLPQNIIMPSIWEYSTALRMLGILNGWITSHSTLNWEHRIYTENRYDKVYRDEYKRNGEPDAIVDGLTGVDLLNQNPPKYFERNLDNFVMIAENGEAEVLFVTFKVSRSFATYTSSSAYMKGIKEHNDIVQHLAEDSDIFLYDFASEFPNDRKYYTDGRHMTLEGNQLRGEMIGNYVIENIMLADQ